MSGLAPEPVDRAIARILAGGLTDWRDITATADLPLAIQRGRSYQQPARPDDERNAPSAQP
jgi:hypothetical protein